MTTKLPAVILSATVFIATVSQASAVWAGDDTLAAAQTQTPAPADQPPSQTPPPPEANPPPPPQGQAAPAPAQTEQAPSTGQWVYTNQYGWVWMPYAQSYTYVGPAGDVAYNYCYYPGYGWSWLLAPWVLGWGPRPYWGVWGYNHFAWYAHPWFHAGVYRPGVWGHVGWAYGAHGWAHVGPHGAIAYAHGYGGHGGYYGGGVHASVGGHYGGGGFGGGAHFGGGFGHGGGRR